jgi:hypothetical protein
MQRVVSSLLIAVAALCVPVASVRAAEATRVVSGSRSPGEMFDFHLSLVWLHEQERAQIRRDREGAGTGAGIVVADELIYRRSRDVLDLRMDFGVYHDFSLFVATPIVLADDRSLDFDREGCGGTGAMACPDEKTATILRDRILPGYGMPSYGLDAEHGRPFTAGSASVFRGPTRRGLEYLGLGARYAIFNQARDDSKPTWLVRFESRFAVGPDQRFDPAKPTANRAVGLGYHQFVFSTAFSRRFESLDPYLGLWYAVPSAPDGSLYSKYPLGGGAFGGPQQGAGADVGVEVPAWEDARTRRRIVFELRGRMELRFLGLAQGPLWEPLSGSSACPTERVACRPGVDRDLTGDGVPDPNPGITRSPTYGVLGLDGGLTAQVGRYARFRGLFGVSFEQDRSLTDGRSGNDVYDAPGRRFRIENARWWHLLIDLALTF